ncbi:alpha/beta hydrolase-fold protein [Luteolibacter flavescens]|uniref:Alpha/beta hydrolase-fold protein n=1 Tax=Luteolibacter flavescens TaxID=1859460 RepID=A0ABT3FVV7_9BACT|nr:alpha/beta hydrolase-fold protein [Luteolibacter flavescens]MCW1887542.1 alpha/beta hydrolase-fold protein [Luteolibacter flavescens]
MKKLLLLAAMFIAPLHAAESWDEREVAHGKIHVHTYEAKSLGKERECVVYTPPGYEDSDQRYPLLVLNHGRGENNRTWTEKGKAHVIYDNLIAEGKAVPAVILMIDGHQPFKDDGTNHHAQAMRAFRSELMEDAIPLVEQSYRLLSGPANRAIAGLSMGGRQALESGLEHADKFAWIGVFSPALPPGGDAYVEKFKQAETYNRAFKLLWIGCGKDDPVLGRVTPHLAALNEARIKHEWHLSDGVHDFELWRVHLVAFSQRIFR